MVMGNNLDAKCNDSQPGVELGPSVICILDISRALTTASSVASG